MKDKKYTIVKAKCIVSRKCGLKEIDEFSFLVSFGVFQKCANVYNALKYCLQKQINMYNEFCFDEYTIVKFENADFKQVGELWL